MVTFLALRCLAGKHHVIARSAVSRITFETHGLKEQRCAVLHLNTAHDSMVAVDADSPELALLLRGYCDFSERQLKQRREHRAKERERRRTLPSSASGGS